MSSIVSNVLRLACGLLVNKLPESTINELKYGEEKEQKFREIILLELDNVLKKLESQQIKEKDFEQKQAKKELFDTISQFKEGLVSLYQVLDKTRHRMEENGVNSVQGQEQRLVLELDIAEEQSFYNAKSSFKKAREDATRLLGNEELSLAERFLITKIQVAARILESMANQTDAADAVGACKVYLQDLHSLPPISEAFEIHFNGGIKSWFNKKQRIELITNVALLNRVVYKYADSYAGENVQPTEWPTIDTGSDVILGRVRSRSIHPVTNFRVRKLIKEFKVPLDITIDPRCFGHEGADEEVSKRPTSVAVNSHGQILVADAAAHNIKIYSTWGKYESTISPSIESGNSSFKPHCLATDREDNVYIVSQELMDAANCAELFVLNKQGNLKLTFSLKKGSNYLSLAVDESCRILLLAKLDGKYQVEVYKSDGKFLRSFGRGLQSPEHIVAAYGEILVSDANGAGEKGSVKVFESSGRLVRQFKVVNSFTKASGIAFNPFSNIIALVTRNKESCEGQVEVRDLSGKLLFLVPLTLPSHLREKSNCEFSGAAITSEGRVAIISSIERSTSCSKETEEVTTPDTEGEESEWDNLSGTDHLNISGNDCQEENANDNVSPNQIEDDDVSPNEVQIDDVSPNQVEDDDVSPNQVEDDNVSPNKVEVDDVSPNQVEDEDFSPNQVKDDNVSPNQIEDDDVTPIETALNEASPGKIPSDTDCSQQETVDTSPEQTNNNDAGPEHSSENQEGQDQKADDIVIEKQNACNDEKSEQETVISDNDLKSSQNTADDADPEDNIFVAEQDSACATHVSESDTITEVDEPGKKDKDMVDQQSVDENVTTHKPQEQNTADQEKTDRDEPEISGCVGSDQYTGEENIAGNQSSTDEYQTGKPAHPYAVNHNGFSHDLNSDLESNTAGHGTADGPDNNSVMHVILVV